MKKGSNNTYLGKSKYDDLFVVMKQLKNQTEKFKPNDYRWPWYIENKKKNIYSGPREK